MLMESSLGVSWFNREVVWRIDNGRTTKFWKDPWVGGATLRERFPRL